MNFNNSDLALAFPASVREDALRVVSRFPQPTQNSATFSVHVGGETLLIPCRIYHDPTLINLAGLTTMQGELLACLLTRHHNGFVREKHLKNIIHSDHKWVPPFVVQLAGEYVIEILDEIRNNLPNLQPELYREFLTNNPAFLALTEQRVRSYWDCYYRNERRDNYAGFQIVELFESLASKVNSPEN